MLGSLPRALPRALTMPEEGRERGSQQQAANCNQALCPSAATHMRLLLPFVTPPAAASTRTSRTHTHTQSTAPSLLQLASCPGPPPPPPPLKPHQRPCLNSSTRALGARRRLAASRQAAQHTRRGLASLAATTRAQPVTTTQQHHGRHSRRPAGGHRVRKGPEGARRPVQGRAGRPRGCRRA
jgi:hypothetical protein